VPRRQFQSQGYRVGDEDGSPDLIACGVYFLVLVILGGIVMFLLLHISGALG
jgi:hypothetical protein